MDNSHFEEFKSVVLDYLKNNEDDLIYGNERLREILASGGTMVAEEEVEGGFFGKNQVQKVVKNRFEWGSDDGPYLANGILEQCVDRIYCVLGNGIVFIDDGFSVQGKMHNRFFIMDLIDFLGVSLTEQLGNSAILEVDGYEYDDGTAVFGFCTLSSESDFDELDTHIENIKKLFRKKIEDIRVRDLEARRGEIVHEIAGAEGKEVVLDDSKDFDILLRDSQTAIIEIDRSYIQKFVKVSQFLKTKRTNIAKIYELVQSAGRIEDLDEIFDMLKEEKYVYDSVLLHSFHMISSLLDSDMITFYEIYESFDKLSIFNSNWENETANKLSNIQSGVQNMNVALKEILYQSIMMEQNIVNSINSMSYMVSGSINALNSNLNTRLTKISSQLKLNNLMTGIQTYESIKRLR